MKYTYIFEVTVQADNLTEAGKKLSLLKKLPTPERVRMPNGKFKEVIESTPAGLKYES